MLQKTSEKCAYITNTSSKIVEMVYDSVTYKFDPSVIVALPEWLASRFSELNESLDFISDQEVVISLKKENTKKTAVKKKTKKEE